MGGSWGVLGRSWGVPGGPGVVLGGSWGRPGGSWEGLGGVLGGSCGSPGGSWGSPEGAWKGSWGILETSTHMKNLAQDTSVWGLFWVWFTLDRGHKWQITRNETEEAFPQCPESNLKSQNSPHIPAKTLPQSTTPTTPQTTSKNKHRERRERNKQTCDRQVTRRAGGMRGAP